MKNIIALLAFLLLTMIMGLSTTPARACECSVHEEDT